SEARECIDANDFTYETVQAEGACQGERDPRRMTRAPGQIAHAGGRERNSRPLDRVQPLAKNEHAENDVHERIDEVAEARFDDPLGRDAEDVGGPVDRDERHARDEPQSNLWVRQRPANADELASKRKPPKRKQAPPYDTVRRHLQDGYTLERFEIKRQQAPN